VRGALGIVVIGLLVGCGGRVTGGADGGEPSSSSGDDAGETSDPGSDGGDPSFAVCPATEPVVGASCSYYSSSTIMVCIYETTPSCVAYECDTTRHWQPDPSCP
jgi:hypothetical protein